MITEPQPTPDFWQQFSGTVLARLTPVRPSQYQVVGKDLLAQLSPQRPDIRQLREQTPSKSLYVLRYETTPLTLAGFLDLVAENVSPTELLYRQRRLFFVSQRAKFSPKKTSTWAPVDNEHMTALFQADERAIDAQHAFVSAQPEDIDEWENTLLAYRLIRDPQTSSAITSAPDLKEYAVKNGVGVDFKALHQGFIRLASEKTIGELVRRGLLNEKAVDSYLEQTGSWLTECALEQSFPDRGHPHYIYPFPYGPGPHATDPDLVPPIAALPELTFAFVSFLNQFPRYLRPGYIYRPERLLAATGNLLEYSRNLLIRSASRVAPSVAEIEQAAPRHDIRRSLDEQLPEIFTQPLTKLVDQLRGLGYIAEAEDVRSVAELVLMCYPGIQRSRQRLGASPGIWNKQGGDTKPQSALLTLEELKQEIWRQGGAARSRKTLYFNLISRIRQGNI